VNAYPRIKNIHVALTLIRGAFILNSFDKHKRMKPIVEAREGNISPFLQKVASEEGISASDLLELVSSGKVIIPHNPRHSNARPVGIGQKLRTKVNVNLGTSVASSISA
jgi:thiamine biosynthesis protein ThiC